MGQVSIGNILKKWLREMGVLGILMRDRHLVVSISVKLVETVFVEDVCYGNDKRANNPKQELSPIF